MQHQRQSLLEQPQYIFQSLPTKQTLESEKQTEERCFSSIFILDLKLYFPTPFFTIHRIIRNERCTVGPFPELNESARPTMARVAVRVAQNGRVAEGGSWQTD